MLRQPLRVDDEVEVRLEFLERNFSIVVVVDHLEHRLNYHLLLICVLLDQQAQRLDQLRELVLLQDAWSRAPREVIMDSEIIDRSRSLACTSMYDREYDNVRRESGSECA